VSLGITVYLDAVGVFGPGMPNWQDAIQALTDTSHKPLENGVVPVANTLPSAERRRVGTVVKLALAAGLDALQASRLEGSGLQTVFASSGGDGDNCHSICEALTETQRMISPTRFTNSVHNAPSGYWGIALRAKPASTSICAFDASFGAGLLDAISQVNTQQVPVLLVSYDTPYPEPLHSVRPLQGSLGVALLLSSMPNSSSLAQLKLSLTHETASVLSNPYFEQLRANNPTARALPILHAVATQQSTTVVIDYLNQLNIEIQIIPYVA
jgi:Beta-ketoacyl synthase, N-terminal domain